MHKLLSRGCLNKKLKEKTECIREREYQAYTTQNVSVQNIAQQADKLEVIIIRLRHVCMKHFPLLIELHFKLECIKDAQLLTSIGIQL